MESESDPFAIREQFPLESAQSYGAYFFWATVARERRRIQSWCRPDWRKISTLFVDLSPARIVALDKLIRERVIESQNDGTTNDRSTAYRLVEAS